MYIYTYPYLGCLCLRSTNYNDLGMCNDMGICNDMRVCNKTGYSTTDTNTLQQEIETEIPRPDDAITCVCATTDTDRDTST